MMYATHSGLLAASTLLLLAAYSGLRAESAEQDFVPLELQSDTGVAEGDGPQTQEQLTDADLDVLAAYLELLLRDDGDASPLVYVEDDPPPPPSDVIASPWKRSRYYRRYPWKRQNGRGRSHRAGGDDNRYMCNPSREDVFQLLLALHEARAGNAARTVNFCNRRRPAAAVFTNIRFLGRRRK